ncbi:MAG: hypothetical protein UW41_C0006G0034 [Candidatus Collierbacteria bacterium GW2011_GWC2_44_18]|uniref:Helix-turn-helix domain-containing protein n=1 Tax=Candidatus Collierbacteria bacterium GW2011_GWC2_44_18 TaxID=1618392 RepID=A0A0G1HQM2_9BACT|nr:MAG: hypothetical protein UW41_C0006G0034 [Candidatus Collierbacteria bacterium GW2011_GWC2_44_18]
MNNEINPNAVYIGTEVRKLLRIGEAKLRKYVHDGTIKASLAGNKFLYIGKNLLQYLEDTKIID